MSAPTSKYISSPAHLLYLFPRRLTKQFAADPQRRVLCLHGLRGRAELRPRPPRRRRARRHVPPPPGRTPVPPEHRRARPNVEVRRLAVLHGLDDTVLQRGMLGQHRYRERAPYGRGARGAAFGVAVGGSGSGGSLAKHDKKSNVEEELWRRF